MNARSVAPSAGWQWIVRAFALIRRKPLSWLVLNLVFVMMGIVLSQLPAGGYALYLLTPVFLGGLVTAAADIEAGRNVELGSLLRGFRYNTLHLVTVGGIYLVGQVLISGVMLALGGPEFQLIAQAGVEGMDPTRVTPEVASRVLMAVLVGMSLFLPLAMAIWFAPALIMFDNQSGWRAMWLSLRASLANMLPFLVYSIASSTLLLLALIPFGIGLVLWTPLMMLTLFTSYIDIFPPAEAKA
ncbi:MAG: BPSS1780 family membrane protein [Burkholderiales bacterium]